MKRIITTLILAAALCGTLHAQSYIAGGYLNSVHRIASGTVSVDATMPGQGAWAGIGACLWLPVNGLSLESGLYADYLRVEPAGTAGARLPGDGADVIYARLPVRFRYEYQFSYDTSLFLGAGPSAVYGAYGKVRGGEGDFFGEDIRRFDLQAGIEGGVKLFGHLQLKAGFDWGIMNLAADTSRGTTMRRNALRAGIAYQF